jgi:hypothetical protein
MIGTSADADTIGMMTTGVLILTGILVLDVAIECWRLYWRHHDERHGRESIDRQERLNQRDSRRHD